MAVSLQRRINRNDTPTHGLITAGSTTAVTLIPENEARISVTISNASNQGVWIRYKTAATDNIKHGIFLDSGSPPFTMPSSSIYPGEISIIFQFGASNDVSFIEY